ncbi:MAG: glycosyltransferase family 2 protein [Desulfamplus sp.]|nr:glycosyltransferase family 2 protein [Desulfamplus sp.]
MATISVIIPTFNRAWSILDAVKSTLNQDYISPNSSISNPSVEVVVVDDGSTDNTSELLKQLKDDWQNSRLNGLKFREDISIKLIKQDNRGVSAARNLGIKKSVGEFIAFLDSDDLWLFDKLSCQIDFFNKNGNAMICQTQEIWIRNGKRVNPKNRHKKLSGMIFEPSLELCLVSPSAVMMRRQFFDIKGLFDESLPACDDYDLWLRTSTDMPIWLVVRFCIIKKGGHSDQLSSKHSLDKYRICSILNLLKKDDLSKSLDSSSTTRILTDRQREAAICVFNKKCRVYAKGCLKRGKYNEAEYYNSLAAIF